MSTKFGKNAPNKSAGACPPYKEYKPSTSTSTSPSKGTVSNVRMHDMNAYSKGGNRPGKG